MWDDEKYSALVTCAISSNNCIYNVVYKVFCGLTKLNCNNTLNVTKTPEYERETDHSFTYRLNKKIVSLMHTLNFYGVS